VFWDGSDEARQSPLISQQGTRQPQVSLPSRPFMVLKISGQFCIFGLSRIY